MTATLKIKGMKMENIEILTNYILYINTHSYKLSYMTNVFHLNCQYRYFLLIL